MKELKLETRVEVYAVGELDNIYRQLFEKSLCSLFQVSCGSGGSIGEWGDTFRK